LTLIHGEIYAELPVLFCVCFYGYVPIMCQTHETYFVLSFYKIKTVGRVKWCRNRL